MNFLIYDINSSLPSRFSLYKFYIVSYLKGIKKLIPKIKISTGIVTGLNQRLQSIYMKTEGYIKLLEEHPPRVEDTFVSIKGQKIDLSDFYNSSEKALHKYRGIYAQFEKMNFLDQAITKRLCEDTLDNLYKIESQLRKICLSNNNPVPEDKGLVEFASKYSLKALSKNEFL